MSLRSTYGRPVVDLWSDYGRLVVVYNTLRILCEKCVYQLGSFAAVSHLFRFSAETQFRRFQNNEFFLQCNWVPVINCAPSVTGHSTSMQINSKRALHRPKSAATLTSIIHWWLITSFLRKTIKSTQNKGNTIFLQITIKKAQVSNLIKHGEPQPFKQKQTQWIYVNIFWYFLYWQRSKLKTVPILPKIWQPHTYNTKKQITKQMQPIETTTNYMRISTKTKDSSATKWTDTEQKGFRIFFIVRKRHIYDKSIDPKLIITYATDTETFFSLSRPNRFPK